MALNLKKKRKKVSQYVKRRRRNTDAHLKTKPEVMSKRILLTIIYIALRIQDQNIFLSDLIR